MRYNSILLSFLFLLSSCDDKDGTTDLSGCFMSANIDGVEWRVEGYDHARFSAEYVDAKDRFLINIHADELSNSQVQQPERRTLMFQFDFAPGIGRYYFNNDASVNLDSGVMAICMYQHNNHTVPAWSIEGYIDIASISNKNVTGTFNFKGKGDATAPNEIVVTGGKFKCLYGGGNIPWPGPGM